MTSPTTHVQVSAVTGGSDWVLACVCGWRTTGPTLSACEYAHGEHVADEKERDRSRRAPRQVKA